MAPSATKDSVLDEIRERIPKLDEGQIEYNNRSPSTHPNNFGSITLLYTKPRNRIKSLWFSTWRVD